jgi:hypothetical protein
MLSLLLHDNIVKRPRVSLVAVERKNAMHGRDIIIQIIKLCVINSLGYKKRRVKNLTKGEGDKS